MMLTPEASNLIQYGIVAMLATVSTTIVQIHRSRNEVRRTRETVEQTKTAVEDAKTVTDQIHQNTQKVGNGFADTVVGRLNAVSADILAMQSRLENIERKIDNGSNQAQ